MHKLKLVKTHVTSKGSVHAQVLLDSKDIGMLYLTQDEAAILLKALQFGSVNAASQIAVEHDILDDGSSEEEYYDEEL
jgi:hypothetical protein